MPRKSDKNPAISGQIVPKLPFAVEPCHDLLTRAQERALAALLSARSLNSAARQAPVPERTLRRWLREDHDFQEIGDKQIAPNLLVSCEGRGHGMPRLDRPARKPGDYPPPAQTTLSAAKIGAGVGAVE